MAKIMYGSLAGAVSGAIGNDVFSHNRFGAYLRKRVIPTKRQTTWTEAARGDLSVASKAFASLEDENRMAWETYAATNPITDRLGQKQILDPHTAFVQINSRILRCGGTMVLVPPSTPPPEMPAVSSVTYDIGAGKMEVTFTPNPLADDVCLWLWGVLCNSMGIRYFGNLLKLITVADAATESPYDFESDLTDRFGTPTVGQHVLLRVMACSQSSGLVSAFVDCAGEVIASE